MKLVYCKKCKQVFSLTNHTKRCSCKESSGAYYKDGIHAWIKGDCVPLGVDSNAFNKAVSNQPEDHYKFFKAFVIEKRAKTVTVIE